MRRGNGKTARGLARCTSAVFIAIGGWNATASATTVSSGPTVLNDPVIGPGTSVATLGYSLPLTQPGTVSTFYFQPGGAPFTTASLPSYISVGYTGSNDYYYTPAYAALTVNGDTTDGHTGYSYQPGTGEASLVTEGTLATITLGAGVPSSFELGVLEDNTGGPGDNTSITFTGSDGSTDTTNFPVSAVAGEDDFFYTTVTNAAPGQTITISGFNAGGSPGFGGVVLDPAPVPEPASMGLLAVAAAALLRRRKI
jgi:PEP-CTERM motif-containing protein